MEVFGRNESDRFVSTCKQVSLLRVNGYICRFVLVVGNVAESHSYLASYGVHQVTFYATMDSFCPYNDDDDEIFLHKYSPPSTHNPL